MTEPTNNESGSALFARIQQLVNERGVDIRQSLNGNALQLQFADGQRILINFDVQTHKVWLAARSGGTEFVECDGMWRAHDQSELLAKLREMIDQTCARNPLNSRPSSAQVRLTARPAPVNLHEARNSHGLRNVLILLLAAAIGFWAAQKLRLPNEIANTNTAPPTQTVSLDKTDPAQQCEGGFPANGSVTVFPESGLRTDGPNDPEITLNNDHAHPLLLVLSAPHTAIPSVSVLIHARQSTTLHLPAGQYDMMFGFGISWCNPRSGFSDGHFLKINNSLTVRMDKPMRLTMQSSGAGMEDFELFVNTVNQAEEPPPPTFAGDGSMEVRRQNNGHFYLPGTIENTPVTFMVDTGASVTSISSDIARAAGIHNCKEVQFQTANGAASGCIALVTHMTLGNFVLQNITVAVMPNMQTNLLGANVLRNFQVSQGDSTMLIGLR